MKRSAGACAARVPAVRVVTAPPGTRAFLAVAVLLFLASAVVTAAECTAMAAMGRLPMAGGGTVSMIWLRMCGRTWPGTAASFLGMWVVMTIAMMLPSLVPMLGRYRAAASITAASIAAPRRLGWLTLQAALGYVLWWSALGIVVFSLGAALVASTMRLPVLAQALPAVAAGTVLVAGLLQFTTWKERSLACCREAPDIGRSWRTDGWSAWRHGLRLGLHCCRCCAGPMVALLAIGLMNPSAMTLATVAITAERLAHNGRRMARIVGAAGIATGLVLATRALSAS